VPNRFPVPNIGNEPLQSDPAYGQNKIERQGVDDTQRIYYVVTSLYNGKLISRRRVPVEDILKNVSSAELEVFERKLDEYEARLMAHAVRGGNFAAFTAQDTADSMTVNRPDDPARSNASVVAGLSREGSSVIPPPSDEVQDGKTAAGDAPQTLRETEAPRQYSAAVSTPEAAPTPAPRRRGRPRKDQIHGVTSILKRKTPPQNHPAKPHTSELSAQRKRRAGIADEEGSDALFSTASSAKEIQLVVRDSQFTAVDFQDHTPASDNIAFSSRSLTSASKPVLNSVKRPRGRPPKNSESLVATPLMSRNKGKARLTVTNGVVPDALPMGAEEVYEVEAVLSDKLLDDGRFYEIKWVGYSETTWEAQDNLADATKLVGEYWKQKNKGNQRMNDATKTLLELGSSNDDDSEGFIEVVDIYNKQV